MAKQPDKKSKEELESEVWSAIAAFEQILEAIPNDRASLEALSNTYEQIGDHTKAKEYMLRLGNVLLEEHDADAARQLVEHIRPYAADDSKVQSLIDRIEKLGGGQPAAAEPAAIEPELRQEKAKGGDRSRVSFSMPDELAFAWNLLEAKELTQEEYSSVVQDLTEMSSVDSATTISVLHVLEGRAFKNLEKVMSFVSKECGTPIVALSCFDLRTESTSLLSKDFMLKRGAMVFELLGKDALAVVMNPYDRQLRKDVEAMAGRKCHFFMTPPPEFDKALETVLKGTAEQPGAAEKKEKAADTEKGKEKKGK
jgi:tetratricopeptide (TPR) repeat protein